MFQDGNADRSDFWRDFHAFLARIGRSHFSIKKGELFWTYGRPDQTKLLTGSVEDALLDIWQAPLEAGIEVSDWPTVISAADWGQTLTFARPKGVSKKYPETVSIKPMPPKDLAVFGVEGAREYMENIIAEEREITTVVRIKNPKRNAPRPRRAPRVGGRHAGHKDLVEAADAAYDQFVEEHEAARLAFRDGHRNVVFPCGTVFWRRVVGVRVASADPPLREVI